MNLLQKLCGLLTRHRFRRKMAVEITLDKTLSCTRFCTCRVCGKVIREEN